MKSQVQQLKIAAVISILCLFSLCAFPQTDNIVMLNALMVSLYAGLYNKIIAGAGLDYLSGITCNTPLFQKHSFSALYATDHKFYGYMDYFINIQAGTKYRMELIKEGYKNNYQGWAFVMLKNSPTFFIHEIKN